MQAFHAVFLTGCLFAVTSAQALDSNFNYYGPNQPFAHPAPPSLNSTPLRTFDDTAPQDFIIIPSDHEFYDSQLPIVADATVRVFVRSYDPERGIYVNDEVLDPTCLLACLSRQSQPLEPPPTPVGAVE